MPADEADTRTRLIRTAAELLWERSFHAAGVDEICGRARARKGSFYHFFPSKSALAVEAIQANWRRAKGEVFDPIFEDSVSGLERLRRIVRGVDALQRQAHAERGAYLGCPFGSLGQEMAHQDEQVRRAVDQVLAEHVDYLERALVQCVAEGEAMPGDLRRRARDLLALLEGGLLMAKIANSPEAFTSILRAMPLLAARDAE
jgi:TetR/AcrR family transcriptional regulator, transcriptional repressor for nem operon